MAWNKRNKVILSDGLGNQLFQFAYAHHLQSHHGGKVGLVANPLAFHESRPLQISDVISACSVTYAESNRVALLLRQLKDYINVLGRRSPIAAKLLSLALGFELEKEEYVVPRELKAGTHIGYFQNSSFVSDGSCILTDIRAGLSVENSLEDRLTIHVRGGDYKNLKHMFGLLSSTYYEKCIAAAIADGAPMESIYVITDDLDFAKEVFRESNHVFRYIGPDEMDSLSAFRFMARSRHLVIGNSTFSWWAARLAAELGGKAWKPSPWFLNYKDVRDAFDGDGFLNVDATFILE